MSETVEQIAHRLFYEILSDDEVYSERKITAELLRARAQGRAEAYRSTLKFAAARQRMQKDAGCECGRKEWIGFLNVYRIKVAEAERGSKP